MTRRDGYLYHLFGQRLPTLFGFGGQLFGRVSQGNGLYHHVGAHGYGVTFVVSGLRRGFGSYILMLIEATLGIGGIRIARKVGVNAGSRTQGIITRDLHLFFVKNGAGYHSTLRTTRHVSSV